MGAAGQSAWIIFTSKPQWYGTQYLRSEDGTWALHTIDESAVSDADRIAMAAPTLAEARQRVEDMNNAR